MGEGREPRAGAATVSAEVATPFASDDRFEVRAQIGAGAMGVVYEAFDRERNVAVAIKALPRLDGDTLRRFKQEFRAVQGIRHPNLVELGELIERHGEWFITMELVDGVDFLRWVRGTSSAAPSGTGSSSSDGEPTVIDATAASHARVRTAAASPGEATAPPPVDEPRLRRALVQLCRGLMALHAANKVHRDIKPANVLVTRNGEVKILDFGLIAEAGAERGSSEAGFVVGTPTYMAPEQATGKLAGPEADWYSVGVVLYVALTGSPPFFGAPEKVIAAKHFDEPPPPRSRVPWIAPDLDAICVGLLRRDPGLRSTGQEVLACLRADDDEGEAAGVSRVVPRSAREAPPLGAIGADPEDAPVSSRADDFVGRAVELAVLARAAEDAREEQVTQLVVGESGVGKSALVARFVRDLRMTHPRPVILHGRCYEREAVPYKALDGVIDALSDHLMSLLVEDQEALLPPDAALLARAFPVLERVPAIAKLARAAPARVAPHMLRARVFASLRGLFGNLVGDRPLTIVIDDLQWSDADSMALLREIVRPPNAPKLLLLATLRDGPAAVAALTTLGAHRRSLELKGLPPDEARALVEHLLGPRAPSGTRSSADTIATESGGHPLFLAELVRHALAPEAETPGAAYRLEDALAARVQRLDPRVREALALVAVAGAPLTLAETARAAGADLAELDQRISILRAERLVLTTGARRSDRVEPYHDRVRASALALLEDGERSKLHGAIAAAIEVERPEEHETLATHWAAAGERERAVRHAVLAAERAAASLAFHRAAEMYRLAIASCPSRLRAAELEARLGRVLSWAGHGLEAAHAYRSASAVDTSGALELRRRAAEQLLSTGHIEEGLTELRAVLGEAGLAYPTSTRGAVASLLWQRGRLRVRGLRFRDRSEADLPQRVRERVDACWAAVVGLSMIDTLRGADFQARHLRLALDAGEPYRVCRALAWESAMETAIGSYGRAATLSSAARSLARKLDDPPQLRALLSACGAVAAYLTGRWAEVRRLTSEVETISRSEWSDEARYELDNGRMLANAALTYMGEVDTFHREQGPLLAEARERRNVHILTNVQSGMNVINWLARGLVDETRAMIEEAISFWSAERVHIPHFIDLYARVQLALYEGKGPEAHRLVEAMRRPLAKSLLLHGPYFRVNMHDLRARSALAAARASAGSPREVLLRQAEKAATALEKERLAAWATPLATVVRAGVAAVRGDAASATRALERSAAGFAAADMALHAAAVRRRLGVLRGGDEGRALVARAEAWMLDKTITRQSEMTAIVAPGF